MKKLINEIRLPFWQLSREGVGNIFEGVDDIRECIRTILITNRGADPLRPEFGSDIYKYIDYPVNTAAPIIVREIIRAIGLLETRVRVDKVTYYVEESRLHFKIFYTFLLDQQRLEYVLDIDKAFRSKIDVPKYEIVFTVTDENNTPIEGASILFEGKTYTTSSYGVATVDAVERGNYPYIISKSGYRTQSSQLSVVDKNEDIEISLEATVIINKGNLYNHYAVATGKLAPDGLRVSSPTDSQTLSNYLGGNAVSGGKLKTTPIETPNIRGWSTPNTGATNEVNFNLIPSGYRHYSNGNYYRGLIDGYAYWRNTDGSMCYVLHNSAALGFAGIQATGGIAVRCLRDATVEEQALADGTYLDNVTDIDGNVYRMEKIGTQVWMNANLRTTKYNDGEAIPNVTDNSAWAAMVTGAYSTYENEPLSNYQYEE